MTLQYHPSEMPLPKGKDISSLDWTGISWDLVLKEGYGDGQPEFAQILVLPGALVSRAGKLNNATWRRTKGQLEHGFSFRTTEDDPDLTPTRNAIETTRALVNIGYEWETKPYLFTLDPSEYPHWIRAFRRRKPGSLKFTPHFIHTLGDAFADGDSTMRRDILNAALTERSNHR